MDKKVLVMMSTYNGEKYIKEQVESILNQQDIDVTLLIRDDNSSDSTLEILKEINDDRIICINENINIGPKLSFFKLLSSYQSINYNEYDYFAFSDQDDIWMSGKLVNGIKKIEKSITYNKATLYYGPNITVDKNMNTLFITPIKITTNKYDILFRNRAQGATMIFNKPARDLIVKNTISQNAIMHDWWINLIVKCCGGNIIVDNVPYLQYRQHDSNVVGSNKDSISSRIFNRLKIILSGKKQPSRVAMLEDFLKLYDNDITIDYKNTINEVIQYRKNKSKTILDKNIYKNVPWHQNVVLFIDIFLNRI
ncbi:glycosyltransferase [Vagococcus lutrae]|uniref:glycosyltransferase n=1 Tax=Vagococcus lutrae TaxID=81947 RepID=UPI00288D9DBC|nr:glycosyltransferase [Vagococcus lutrae]MDT2811543.1 glycosyltransferase [Vagococcus lutrae]